jgi:hypothetical protein
MSEIEEKVIEKIRQRAELGLNKYNTTMERTDLTLKEWINHAMEEAMDLSVYLQRILMMLDSLDVELNTEFLEESD